jgi:HEAT repeat protein
MAAWTTGEHESNRPAVLERLLELAQNAEEPLVREASVAALGAIGDPAAVDVIIAACSDKPAVRRRAVLALAPFDGPAVEAAIEQALEDRDWQVRQAAEDLRRAQARPN